LRLGLGLWLRRLLRLVERGGGRARSLSRSLRADGGSRGACLRRLLRGLRGLRVVLRLRTLSRRARLARLWLARLARGLAWRLLGLRRLTLRLLWGVL
jgi:hypothetical protein